MFTKRDKNIDRIKRHKRVRKNLSGTTECPRLCVYRSNASIYAQIIDDVKGITLCAASSADKDLDIAGKTKFVDTDNHLVIAARDIGVSFGD